MVEVIGRRAAIFAMAAWQLCLAPLWVVSGAAAGECQPVTCCAIVASCPWSATFSDDASWSCICLMACRVDCAGPCERIRKDPPVRGAASEKIDPPQTVALGSAEDAAPSERIAFVAANPRQPPDLILIRTFVLLV